MSFLSRAWAGIDTPPSIPCWLLVSQGSGSELGRWPQGNQQEEEEAVSLLSGDFLVLRTGGVGRYGPAVPE